MRRSPVRFRAAAPRNQALRAHHKDVLFSGVTPGLHLPRFDRFFRENHGRQSMYPPGSFSMTTRRSLTLVAALSVGLVLSTSTSALTWSALDLGTFGGSTLDGPATGINASEQVVGTAFTPSAHAFITGPNGVGMTDLGTLGGSFSRATSVNAFGQVVGYATTLNGDSHAFITGPNGVGMTDLGTLGSSSF
jgi:probable HAF family extracellular repeat protein